MPPGNGRGPRKIASIGVHASRWVTSHGYALNVDLDPAPFTDWITACGLDGAHFTTMTRELDRPLHVDDVRPGAASAIADVFGLRFEACAARRRRWRRSRSSPLTRGRCSTGRDRRPRL